MGHLAEAVEDYTQATVLDPRSKDAQNKLASAKEQILSASTPS